MISEIGSLVRELHYTSVSPERSVWLHSSSRGVPVGNPNWNKAPVQEEASRDEAGDTKPLGFTKQALVQREQVYGLGVTDVQEDNSYGESEGNQDPDQTEQDKQPTEAFLPTSSFMDQWIRTSWWMWKIYAIALSRARPYSWTTHFTPALKKRRPGPSIASLRRHFSI